MVNLNKAEYWESRSSYPTDELDGMADLAEKAALGDMSAAKELADDARIRLLEARRELDYFRKLHEVE